MRTKFYILLLLTTVGLWPSKGFAYNYVTDAACVGAWYMNGAKAGIETDRSGENNHLSYVDNGYGLDRVVLAPTGYTGTSRKADSTTFSGWLERADGGTLDLTGQTVSLSAWVQVVKAPISGDFEIIVGKWDHTGNHRQYILLVEGTGSSQFKFRFSMSSNGTASTHVYSTTTTYAVNTWYHVAGVGDNTDLRLYVDGALASTPVAYTGGMDDRSAKFMIGNYGGSGAYKFDGYIDEVAVFSDALTALEVDDIFDNGLTGDKGASDYPYYHGFENVDGNCPDEADLHTWTKGILDSLMGTNPPYWTLDSSKHSIEGRAIYRVSINPPNAGRDICVVSGVHGDDNGMEGLAPYTVVSLLKFLADTSYYLVNWDIIPMLNPDGCVGLSRLNANDVNINRNFDWHWADNPNTCPHSECGGTAAWSEVETRIFRDWVLPSFPNQDSSHFDLLIDIHAPSDMVVRFHEGTYYHAANASMAALNLHPFIITSSAYYTTSGMLCGWSDNVAGVANSWVLETEELLTAADFAEESNRIIAYLDYYAGELDSFYVADSTPLDYFKSNPHSQLPFGTKPFNQ